MRHANSVLSPTAHQSGTSIGYVKGFLGVVGRDLNEITLRFPNFPAFTEVSEYRDHTLCLKTFGVTNPTLPPDLSTPPYKAWVKGRPFYLTEGSGIGRLDVRDRALTENILSQIDGRFSLCLLQRDGLVLCATDFIGSGSVFYACVGGNVYFATHLGPLLQVIPAPLSFDSEGLASFLIAKGTITGATIFRGINRLRSAQYLVIDPPSGRIVVGRYTTFESLLGRRHDHPKQDELLDAFGSLLDHSIKREQLPANVAVLLSGGRDSTALALALRKKREDIRAVTFGARRSYDVRKARITAWRLGIPHEIAPFRAWDFGTHLDLAISFNGGYTSLGDCCNCPGFEFAGTRCGLMVCGYLGDVITGGHLPKGGRISFNDALRICSQRLSPPDVDPKEFFPSEIDGLVEAQRTFWNSLEAFDGHQRAVVMDLAIRQGAWLGATFDLYETYGEIAFPFYYRPLFRFMLNLSSNLVQGQVLYDAWRSREHNSLCPPARLGWDWSPRSLSVLSHRILHRVIDQLLPAPQLFNWRHRIHKSAKTLSDSVRQCCDKRLASLAEHSLLTELKQSPWRWDPQRTYVPTVLLAVAPCLAMNRFSR